MAAVDERDNEAHVKDIQKKITQVNHLQKTWNQFDQIQTRNFLEQK